MYKRISKKDREKTGGVGRGSPAFLLISTD